MATGGPYHSHPKPVLKTCGQLAHWAYSFLLVDLPLMDRRESLDARQRALQLADVSLDFVCDEAEHLFRDQAHVVAELGVKDGEASLEVRRLDISDKTPFESRTQPVLERRDLLGRAVGRDDDLFVDLVKRIEGMEELFLG